MSTSSMTTSYWIAGAWLGVVAVFLHQQTSPKSELLGKVDSLLDAAPPRLAALMTKARLAIRDVRPLPIHLTLNPKRRTHKRGWFDRKQGILYIATHAPNGKPLPDAVISGVLVHEVAHACLDSGAHSAEWKNVYVDLLNIATHQLGWAITLECSSCPMYGLCHASECPLCAWKRCAQVEKPKD